MQNYINDVTFAQVARLVVVTELEGLVDASGGTAGDGCPEQTWRTTDSGGRRLHFLRHQALLNVHGSRVDGPWNEMAVSHITSV